MLAGCSMANNRSILVGSGFHSAFLNASNKGLEASDEGFKGYDYEAIFGKVKKAIKDVSKELYRFLEKNEGKTSDLEYMLWVLSRSIKCIPYDENIYVDIPCDSEQMIKKMQNDYKLLKEAVIEVLASEHPEYKALFSAFNGEFVKTCSENLRQFDRLYTINYDMIIYWLLIKQDLILKRDESGSIISKGKFKDSFSKKSDKHKNLLEYSVSDHLQNLFFLHGALHLVSKDKKAYKLYKGRDELSIKEIKEMLLNEKIGFENCIIFNASSDEKLAEIYKNDYLIKSYQKISTAEKDFIVYGCTPYHNINKKNAVVDKHLWSCIVNSKISDLYISVRDISEGAVLNEIKENLDMHKTHGRLVKVHFFSHKDCSIWQNEDFIEVVRKKSKNIGTIAPASPD